MLAADLGIGSRELVALVGGGGKSTLMFRLGRDLAARGSRVLLTTTTKMGPGQMAGAAAVCRSTDVADVDRALDGGGPVLLVAAESASKIEGPPPAEVDRLFAEARVDHLLAEADGARGRPLKAPAAHEPVIPAHSTVVVVAMGIDAVGRTVAEAAHRPAEVMALTGLGSGHVLRPEDCAAVVGHPDGGLRGVPSTARVVVALTKVAPGPTADAAARIGAILERVPRIERVVTIPRR